LFLAMVWMVEPVVDNQETIERRRASYLRHAAFAPSAPKDIAATLATLCEINVRFHYDISYWASKPEGHFNHKCSD